MCGLVGTTACSIRMAARAIEPTFNTKARQTTACAFALAAWSHYLLLYTVIKWKRCISLIQKSQDIQSSKITNHLQSHNSCTHLCKWSISTFTAATLPGSDEQKNSFTQQVTVQGIRVRAAGMITPACLYVLFSFSFILIRIPQQGRAWLIVEVVQLGTE